ncbi:leucine-rich repeat-containing protein 27 isoform X2 [Macrotis lagotis]|uniref:leucine-rich repeat-containing protein 27 isoform X2 n=1 Tax=Macrotis lagotis TaxID=92651 RepID=UPI003D6987BA
MEGPCSGIESKESVGHLESNSGKTRTMSITIPKDVQNVIEGILCSPSPILDLSKRGLELLSEEIFKVPFLKQLHLQRNELSIIPKDFFQLLPNLVWLDLRHNKIKAIPSGIGSHKNLKTLLMEKNPIKSLPVELGNLMSLKALNLRNCPLEFPPEDIIQKGLLAILAFLRNWALQQAADADPPCQESLEANHDAAEGTISKVNQDDPEGKEYIFPHVEKLNLTEVMEPSVDTSEDCPNEEEMKQFLKLRQEIIASEKAEILTNKFLPIQLPLNLQNNLAKERGLKPKYSFSSIHPTQAKKDEERRVAALKELKEKQALIEQRKRDKKMLQKWREQAEVMKKEKEILMNMQHPSKATVYSQVLAKAPFATNLEEGNKEYSYLDKKKSIQLKLTPEQNELRASKDREIEERIKHHMEVLRERRKKAKGTPQEEMEKATLDFETAKKLHEDIRKRYLNSDRREYRFTAFTGELNLQSPISKPHNIFFNMKF